MDFACKKIPCFNFSKEYLAKLVFKQKQQLTESVRSLFSSDFSNQARWHYLRFFFFFSLYTLATYNHKYAAIRW